MNTQDLSPSSPSHRPRPLTPDPTGDRRIAHCLSNGIDTCQHRGPRTEDEERGARRTGVVVRGRRVAFGVGDWGWGCSKFYKKP
jgi:hypothetical protein